LPSLFPKKEKKKEKSSDRKILAYCWRQRKSLKISKIQGPREAVLAS